MSPILTSRSRAMSNAELPVEVLAIIEVIAGAIRRELGEDIDAYPGWWTPDGADPLNRAFRAIVESLLSLHLALGESPTVAVSRALRRVAEQRLAADRFDARESRLLLEAEPGSPDDWLTFLILSSRTQVRDALRSEDRDHA